MQDASGPADDLCLSYVNTRYWRGSPRPTESLNGIADVTGWVTDNVPGAAPFAADCAARWAASPQEACSDKSFLARPFCIHEQCQLSRFRSHPQCIKLREDQQRRDEQRGG